MSGERSWVALPHSCRITLLNWLHSPLRDEISQCNIPYLSALSIPYVGGRQRRTSHKSTRKSQNWQQATLQEPPMITSLELFDSESCMEQICLTLEILFETELLLIMYKYHLQGSCRPRAPLRAVCAVSSTKLECAS